MASYKNINMTVQVDEGSVYLNVPSAICKSEVFISSSDKGQGEYPGKASSVHIMLTRRTMMMTGNIML